MTRIRHLVPLSLAFALAACGSSPSMNEMPPPSNAAAVTFHKDVEPILQKRCMGCHSPGHIAPFNLTSYDEAKANAPLLVAAVKSGRMPPWGAMSTDACKPRFGWKDDPRLAPAEIKVFEDWVGQGTREGDSKDAPPPWQAPPDGLPGMERELAPLKPFVSSGPVDQFRCFVIDPGFTQPAFLNGWHIVAGNPQVVHHVLMFVNPDGSAKKKMDADGGYTCFGGAGVNAQLIAAWAPGTVPAVLPANIATTVSPGAVFVMQIHYHPAGRTNAPDLTKFQIRSLKSPPQYQLITSLIGNFAKYDPKTGDGLQPDENGNAEFRIPAGATAKEIKQHFTIPPVINGMPIPELRLYTVGTHMHYVGQGMRIEVDRGPTVADADPRSECLLETPKWDFHWQRGYTYDTDIDKLPRLHGLDKLRMRCVYNNSMSNPFLAEALAEQNLNAPHDVTLGEATLDEMCLGVFGTLIKM